MQGKGGVSAAVGTGRQGRGGPCQSSAHQGRGRVPAPATGGSGKAEAQLVLCPCERERDREEDESVSGVCGHGSLRLFINQVRPSKRALKVVII